MSGASPSIDGATVSSSDRDGTPTNRRLPLRVNLLCLTADSLVMPEPRSCRRNWRHTCASLPRPPKRWTSPRRGADAEKVETEGKRQVRRVRPNASDDPLPIISMTNMFHKP